jgi:hypothetical protein
VTFGESEREIAKNRHIVCQRTNEREKCLKKIRLAENIMTAKKIAVGKKLYFFTIIADILFGYCDVFVGELSTL